MNLIKTINSNTIQALAPYFVRPEPSTLAPEPAVLGDPSDYPGAEAHVALLQKGASPEEVYRWLPPELRQAIASADPTMKSSKPSLGSTWTELGKTLGPITWAWDRWLPNSMLTMIVAEEATGKSILCLRIAECYLIGSDWPDGTPFSGRQGKVLWCEAESSQGLNFDRATKWGLPTDRILSPLTDPLEDICFQNDEHMAAIECLAREPDVVLILIDSLSGANVAKENDAAMVHVVKRIASLAKVTRKPVLLTHHLRKFIPGDGDRVTLDRIRGAGAITQPARVVWALDKPSATQGAPHRLSVIKNNMLGIERSGEPLGVSIGDEGVWFGDAPTRGRHTTKQEQATEIIKAFLADGPKPAKEVFARIEEAGLSKGAADRAKKPLGIDPQKRSVPGSDQQAWYWELPESEASQSVAGQGTA